jgi:hypothetical protein
MKGQVWNLMREPKGGAAGTAMATGTVMAMPKALAMAMRRAVGYPWRVPWR